MEIKIKCIHCKGEEFTKYGTRQTQHRGKIQKYKCSKCGKFFTNDDGFYKMKNNEKIVTMSIDMYLSNLSSRKMRNQLKRHMETKISHVSVLDWVRKYIQKVQMYVNKMTPVLGNKFYADETIIERKKYKDWFWCNVDWETRFISGYHYSIDRSLEDAITFLDKSTSKKLPDFIMTDGLPAYKTAMKKLFSNWR